MVSAISLSSYYEKLLATGEVKCIDDEIPFEIPQGWEWCRMGGIIELLSGQDFMPEKYNSKNQGIPYITGASSISNGKLIINRWTECPSVIGKLGDLLIVCKGSGVGKMCFCNVEKIHIARQIQIIRGFSSFICMSYLKLIIDANLSAITSNAQGVIPGISREHILNLIIPIPPFNAQQHIIKKLKLLQPLIQLFDSKQEELNNLDTSIKELLKKSILQEAIQGKLVPQIAEEGIAQELLEQIRQEKQELVKEGKLKKSTLIDSVIYKGDDNKYYERIGGKDICIDDEILFEIPDSWVWCRLGFLFNHNTGKALNASNKEGSMLPYITTSNLYWGQFDLSSVRQMYFKDSEIEKCSVSNGDLLVCEGGDIGRAAIWPYDTPMCIQNHIHKLRSYNQLDTLFYYYIFQAYKYNGYIGGKGIGIQGLSSKALHNMLVPLPPINEQIRITSKISSLFQFI